MANVRLFDGAMGSPSGIGLVTENLEYPQEELLRIASILYFLKEDGVEVFRANMSTKPDAFWSEPNLLDKMMEEGNSAIQQQKKLLLIINQIRLPMAFLSFLKKSLSAYGQKQKPGVCVV